MSSHCIGIPASPMVVDVKIASLYPPEFSKPLPECRDTDLRFLIILDVGQYHTNAPDALRWLRLRRNRPQ